MATIQESNNAFEDLGFDAEESAHLRVRADLMLDLRKFIEAKGWTQKQAASFFGETQPRISNLMQGEISRFSVDTAPYSFWHSYETHGTHSPDAQFSISDTTYLQRIRAGIL